MQAYKNDSFSYLLTLVSVSESFSQKSIFLKIRGFFSLKFFQGHDLLTYYPDSEFHGH